MTLTITALWDALGWAILHSLWQGALIGFIVWGVRTAATQRRAWLRYLAGMGGLVATFAAFLATFMILAISRVERMGTVDPVGDLVGPGGASDLTLSISVLPLQASQSGLAEALVPWLGMVWAVGFAFLSLQGYRAYAATRWLATQGLQSPGTDWTARFTTLIQRSHTHAKIRLFVSQHVNGPMTLGALRPIVLVPVGILTSLPTAQIEAILLHELAHIRRHDFLFGLIQTAIRTVLYFNPAVVMMSRQIDEDREQACDDIAVSITGNAADLARGLAALRLGRHKPDLVMAADGGPLLARLNRLMGRPVPRSASSRLSAAAISALLLGTAACSTVSMAHPHPPVEPAAPATPQPAVTPAPLQIPDTVIRAAADEKMRNHAANNGRAPQAIAVPPMPAMPVMPAVPNLPDVPSPAPIFGDYASADAFEEAMDAWGETMEVWGEEVERRFEGDWESRMEEWGEQMEVWGETVGELSEEHAAHSSGVRFEALAELKGLAKLADLEDLANLTTLKDGVWVIDGASVDAKADEVRGRVLRHIESRIQDIDWQKTLAENQAERSRDLSEARAEREVERAQERADLAQQRAELARERAAEHKERQAEHSQRIAEAHARADAARHQTRSSSHSQQTITVSGAEKGETVVINGRALDIDTFRRTVMSALVEDGLIKSGDRSVTLSMCGDSLEVDGRAASQAQAKRYAAMLEDAGFNGDHSVVVKLKPDSVQFKLSGSDHKSDRNVVIGPFHHGDND